MSAARGSEPVLAVRDLCTWFETPEGTARAVDGVSFELARGETLALVGESGSGKTLTALSILGLVPPPGRIVRGSVRLAGRELVGLPRRALERVRGREVGMVFQEPLSALNPVFPVGEQVAEVLRAHRLADARGARERAQALLAEVGLPDARERARLYPHQLSGGQRQRVVIAMAMACEPAVLLADEPTTALDVTIQAQVLELIAALQRRSGTALLLITHDLGVVAQAAERVCVLYAGRVVESADTIALFERPRHPYTLGLLRSLPRRVRAGERLAALPGAVPPATRWPAGCRFHPRCALARPRCALEEPPLRALEGGARAAACHYAEEVGAP